MGRIILAALGIAVRLILATLYFAARLAFWTIVGAVLATLLYKPTFRRLPAPRSLRRI